MAFALSRDPRSKADFGERLCRRRLRFGPLGWQSSDETPKHRFYCALRNFIPQWTMPMPGSKPALRRFPLPFADRRLLSSGG
jgi:hypothetical protein